MMVVSRCSSNVNVQVYWYSSSVLLFVDVLSLTVILMSVLEKHRCFPEAETLCGGVTLVERRGVVFLCTSRQILLGPQDR